MSGGVSLTQYQSDSESAQLNRLKYAPSGWTYQAHFMEVTTSKIGGLVSLNKEGTQITFGSLKFYRADGTEITTSSQTDLDAECVHTKLIWVPDHAIEIISGSIKPLVATSDDIRLWATAAPHIPAAQGGTKRFVHGGLNFKYLNAKEELRTDGRASKHIALDTTHFSHTWHFDVKHPVGRNFEFQLLMEFYKA